MHKLGKYESSVIALVAANLVPLAGVLLFDWSVFAIMAIYWAENVIVGAINVLKMITCAPDSEKVQLPEPSDAERAEDLGAAIASLGGRKASITAIHHASKIFFVPFFTVHYGVFCLVHGIFVLVLFGGGADLVATGSSDPSEGFEQLAGRIFASGIALAVLALTASHLFSFFKNYLAGGEFRRTDVTQLMFQPYGRIVVMHLAILIGGVATMFLGSPVFALLILIVGKTVIDIKLHLRQHRGTGDDANDELGQVETV